MASNKMAGIPPVRKIAGPAGTNSLPGGARDSAAAAHRQAPYNPKPFPKRV